MDKRKKKLLFVTKNFPPEIGGGIRRIEAVYNLMNKNSNLEIDVVTAVKVDKSVYTNVKFIKQFFLKDSESENKIRFKKSNVVIKLIDKSFVCWMPFVLMNIIFKKYDFVYASCPVFTNVIIGFLYKFFRFFKPKLIIEYRDFFSFNPIYHENINKRIIRFFEKIIIKISDYIIVTTGSMGEILSRITLKNKIFLIRNYISFEDLNDVKKLNKIDFDSDFFNIGHIGKLNTGRTPEKILNLIKYKVEGKKIALHFIGVNNAEKEWISAKALELKLNLNNIFFKEQVERTESLKYMKSFDGLLLIINYDAHIKNGFGIPGKLYDYAAVNNNIFSDMETFENLSYEFDMEIKYKFDNFINFKINDYNVLDDIFNQTINKIIG
ncbi:MAG: hypothetical protein JXB50_02760 [Spirochaetes bacterium]|nr:hypothetical protein [Spirochaetota bacterium]